MKSKNNIKYFNLIIVFAFFCFVVILARVGFLSLSSKIDGINIQEFAESRSVVKTSILASRGSIYDVNGEELAQNVCSYTLIAYLDSSRSEGEKELYHVQDKKTTAEKLATVINMKEEDILSILSQEGYYQVEFGYAGKDLSEMQKEKIDALNLPGIDFIEDEKRYYPNGDFASYIVGYARNDEEGEITGELGIESLLDDTLKGKDGSTTYQKDVNGYKIPGTKEYTIPAEDGSDIYLTIDSNIQLFIEQAISDNYDKYKPEWMTVVVADAKTGAILGASQKPSYDPNVVDIDNYLDLTVAEPYEPGSIMKIYTYMAAMEAGTYDGDKTFTSGHYVLDDGTIINDWNITGWGDITYDKGFQASSNVGVINIVNNFIDRNILYNYFKKMGFGQKTGITLANEQAGKLGFTYQSEVYNAAFGQGITTTPMQHIQALTSIANNGVMLQPYIISKVKSSTGKIVYEGKKTEVGIVASHETTDKIKQLMYDTVHSNWVGATGGAYKIAGFDMIGKTGTAQIVNPYNGNYYTDNYHSIRSFVGMWPKDDPQIIIYASVKKSYMGSTALSNTVKTVAINTSKYLNIFNQQDDNTIENYKVDNYLNKDVTNITKTLTENNIDYLVLGNGKKIIDQYPKKDYLLNSNEKLILLTYDTTYTMPNLINYGKKEVQEICNMLELNCTFTGNGYVSKQSISKGIKLKKNDSLEILLKN